MVVSIYTLKHDNDSLYDKLLHYDTLNSYRNMWINKSAGLKWLNLTHWGRLTHICISKLTIISSDNGLSPDWRPIAGILLIGPLGTNFSETLIETHIFSSMKMHLKMSSGKRRPFCLGLNVLKIKCKLSFFFFFFFFLKLLSGAHFTNNFAIRIQIRWKFILL